ncbi:hypothetical protein LEP1GSC037_0622 [Leptospira interrogans str. 2006001854]|uniref:Uncharacterized protein n=1 Tax=Leptospira interrogans str. 2006001854 TaxID=1001590 RepID=M6GFJ7_LEPIR|nr:hypothetical protein LEP1GSC037_0622 [Leptospira interrogans str. 2006001854]OOB95415.1 hypothetical protein B0191_07870 [Leptospira interrogans serovar Hardjo]QEH99433.1 hypothetical protein FWJ33_08325 [Leptospira interrogans serovar Hardjo]
MTKDALFFKTVGTLTGLRINIHSLILKKKISKYSILTLQNYEREIGSELCPNFMEYLIFRVRLRKNTDKRWKKTSFP